MSVRIRTENGVPVPDDSGTRQRLVVTTDADRAAEETELRAKAEQRERERREQLQQEKLERAPRLRAAALRDAYLRGHYRGLQARGPADPEERAAFERGLADGEAGREPTP